MIHSKEVGLYGIDGIIILSFKYRKEYYLFSHPYRKYAKINRWRTLLSEESDTEKKENLFMEMIKSFVEIKDFRLAAECAEALIRFVDREKSRAGAISMETHMQYLLLLMRVWFRHMGKLQTCGPDIMRETVCLKGNVVFYKRQNSRKEII